MTEEEAQERLEKSPLKTLQDYLEYIKQKIREDLNSPIDFNIGKNNASD